MVMPHDGSARPPIVVVSNRGPLAFRRNESGELESTKAGGGLVATLAPAMEGTDALWVSTAVTAEDREAAARGPVESDGFRLRHVALKPTLYRQYYDVIANGTLWFLHHNLFDLSRRPRIDGRWWDAWHTYVEVNEAFARAVVDNAPQDAVVLIHDYHLTMLGKTLSYKRPDLKTVHFHHTPFTDGITARVLPPSALEQLLDGLAGHDACGFHSQRWADNFAMTCADVIGRVPNTFVAAAAPNYDELREVAASDECRAAVARLDELAAGRKLIVRVDRIELAKNLLRGFLAYDDVLQRCPRWRGRVTFVAHVYPSREGLAEYLAYRNEVEGLVAQINERWRTDDWEPIVLRMRDDFPGSVAAFLRYDVLLVNPIRDGLNLVAKEGAVVNERNGAVVLSREAGSWHELSEAAIGINPFDIQATSDALVHALEMSLEERVARATRLRDIALRRSPHDWFEDQIRAVLG